VADIAYSARPFVIDRVRATPVAGYGLSWKFTLSANRCRSRLHFN